MLDTFSDKIFSLTGAKVRLNQNTSFKSGASFNEVEIFKQQ